MLEYSMLNMAIFFHSWSISALLLIFSVNIWAASSSQETIDNELGILASTSYNQLAKTKPASDNLGSVYVRANSAYQKQNYAATLQILAENRALDASHLSDKELQPTVRLALQLYAHPLVEILLQEAQQQGDALTEAKLTFELARFYAINEHWAKVTTLLANDSVFELLNREDTAEAYVILGTAMQKQKKHREAIKIYEKVNEGSAHFRIAQLNLASALLRQDWWTDAHIAINSALKENTGKRDQLDFRLYTMMGYSQIQFGFYRDARESFRNIAISSQYAQRALLGLGIAALHQQDFIGALNAFDKLRQQETKDISVAEAYLLSAFSLRQLEQFDAATSRYQEAINYYQTLSAEIESFMVSEKEASIRFLRSENNNDGLLRNNAKKIALLNDLPELVAVNTKTVSALKDKIANQSAQHANHLLREEKNTIDSYLSQSRFGLASLYDHK